MKRVKILVTGDVQGVSFRYNAKRQAEKLQIYGWIKNDPDGRVRAVVEGDQEAVQSFEDWCRVGPPMAEVEKVETQVEEYQGEFNNFEVK